MSTSAKIWLTESIFTSLYFLKWCPVRVFAKYNNFLWVRWFWTKNYHILYPSLEKSTTHITIKCTWLNIPQFLNDVKINFVSEAICIIAIFFVEGMHNLSMRKMSQAPHKKKHCYVTWMSWRKEKKEENNLNYVEHGHTGMQLIGRIIERGNKSWVLGVFGFLTSNLKHSVAQPC